MPRKLLMSGVVLLLLVVAVPTAFAAPATDEVSGTLGACSPEEVTLIVEGEEVTIAAPEGEPFDCGALQTQAAENDGTVTVDDTVVEGDTCEAGQHPVVCRIANDLGVEYEVIWALFREGELVGDAQEVEGEVLSCDEGTGTATIEYADEEGATQTTELTGVDCGDYPEGPITFTMEGETSDYEGVVGLGRIMTAIRLSEQLDNAMTWQELLAWHLDGNGWGSVIQASRLATDSGDVETILEARAQCNWGQIRKGECEGYEDLEIGHPGQGNQPCEGGPPCGNQGSSGNPNAQSLNGNNGNNGNGPPEGRGGGPPEGRGPNK